MTVFLSVLSIIGGLVNIFAKDTMWTLAQGLNKKRDGRSERTASWDTWGTIWGSIMVAIGIIGLLLSVVRGINQTKQATPVGIYSCQNSATNAIASIDERLEVIEGGKGNFRGASFNWVQQGSGTVIQFSGNPLLVSGTPFGQVWLSTSSDERGDINFDAMTVKLSNGESLRCIRR